jgi:UDP-N-acetylmuramoylalanine--D-glutamate ligase
MQQLLNQSVLILGLGDSGLSMARWCVRCGAQVQVVDTRAEPPHLAALRSELPQVSFVHGAFDAALLQGSQDGHGIRAVFKSPGLSPEAVASVWQAAQAAGLWVGTELTLFAQALSDLQQSAAYHPQVLAITGTNGKTTVTALTGQLLERAGLRVAIAGNIGPTLLDTLTQALNDEDPLHLPQVWVLELSSFQLDGVTNFEPTAAVVLNLTQDHLDWHGDMRAYAAAKARIFGKHGLLVLNREDQAVMSMLPEPVRVKLQKPQARNYATFGGDLPQRPGDYGLETVNGMTWLVRALEADETHRRRKDEVEAIHIQRLMPADALRIRGRHNALNALAALALAGSTQASLAPMLFGLREYRGEPHRVESVAVLNDVEYFDDSKGTNVGATVAALQGLGVERRLVVILGGDGKGQDFSPLQAPITHYARGVVLMGRDAPVLREVLKDCGVPLVDAGTLPDAVVQARRMAQARDAVLLSPACASLDMFRNYAHRAEVFVSAVQALADEVGQTLDLAQGADV